jgi:uncharacterized iron-regulated membrane protein
MRQALLTVHLILALTAGAVITVLGVTGSIMAFEPEIDRLQHRALMNVVPSGHPHSLLEIGDAVRKATPGVRIDGITVGATLADAYVVSVPRAQVYVDPYTLRVLGRRPNGSGWLASVHQIHLRLFTTAAWGRQIVRWSGVVLVVLLVSGLYLWWPTKRIRLTTGASPFRTWFDLHNAVGVFSLVFLLLLSLTGVFIGFDGVMVPLAYRLTSSTPSAQVSTRVTAVKGARQISPDQALGIAREALPGTSPFYVSVVSPTAAYVVRSRFPEDRTPGGRSLVIIDSYTGRVMFAEGSRTAPAGRRIEILNRAMHTGDIFGLPSKIVMSLASLMAPVQLVSGLMLWLRRKGRVVQRRAVGPRDDRLENQ